MKKLLGIAFVGMMAIGCGSGSSNTAPPANAATPPADPNATQGGTTTPATPDSTQTNTPPAGAPPAQ